MILLDLEQEGALYQTIFFLNEGILVELKLAILR